MNKLFVRIALVLAGFAGLTIPAKAQSVDGLVVKIPFEFVAAGQTLPAGEYKITRLRDDKPRVLLLTSLDNRNQSVLLTRADGTVAQKRTNHNSASRPSVISVCLAALRRASTLTRSRCLVPRRFWPQHPASVPLPLPPPEATNPLRISPRSMASRQSSPTCSRLDAGSLAGCVASVDTGGPRKGRPEKGDIG